MAGSNGVPVDMGVVDGLKSNISGPQINVDDINAYEPAGLSPDQLSVYKQSQTAPPTGSLSPYDYYPDLNNQVNVGNYSGSEVGSISLFAPGGGLVPLGYMDARDLSVHKAALQKQQEIDAFAKRYQAPTTKHTTVQPELEKMYFSGLEKWRQNALKKSGGDPGLANKILENDPKFNAWNQSAQTAAKIEDSVVEKFSKIHDDVKTGKFVATPELKKAENDFWSAYNGLGESPFNPNGHNLNKEWLKLNAEHDFAEAANETMKEAVMQQDAAAGVDTSNPDYIKSLETTKKFYSPETLTAGRLIMKQKFPDMADADIAKRFNPMFNSVEEKKNVSVSQKREPQGGQDYKYDTNDFSDEEGSVNTKVSLSGGGTRESDVVTTDQLTFKKPIKVVMPIGKDVYFTTEEGLVPSKNLGNKDVTLGSVVMVDVLDSPGNPLNGTPLSRDQKGKYPSRKESMTVGKYYEGNGDDKEEKSFFVPTVKVENSLVGERDEKGNVVKGVPVDEHYKRRDKYNAETESKKTIKHPLPNGKPKTVKQNGYTYTWNESTGQYE